MEEIRQEGNSDRLFKLVWFVEVVYFIVQPVLHNASITGLVWKVGIIFLALITLSQMRYFEKRDFVIIAFLLGIIIVGMANSGALTNVDKWFSIVAFINLVLFVEKSESITISKRSVDYLYWISVVLTILFTLYIFLGIANKVTTDGRVWTCRYFVFNLDNSNTAGMYLYAIYCMIFINLSRKKEHKFANMVLLLILFYMIWRTEARTCLAATLFVTAFGLLFRRKKIPNCIIIGCFAFPIIFIFVYLWLFYSGFADITMGDKTLFSGRQETFVTYLNMVRTPLQVLFGNIGKVTFSNAHNGPLAIYCSTGVFGVVAFYYIFIKRVIIANVNASTLLNRMAVVSILGFIIQTSGEAGFLLGGFPGVPFICTFFLLASGRYEDTERCSVDNEGNYGGVK